MGLGYGMWRFDGIGACWGMVCGDLMGLRYGMWRFDGVEVWYVEI